MDRKKQNDLSPCFIITTICYCMIFFSDPPETDLLTPRMESSHCPWRDGERVQGKDCERTELSMETGQTRGGPSPRTYPRARNERGPYHTSGTGAPALRSENLGRFEQEMSPRSLIWIYCWVKEAWRDDRAGANVCVYEFLYVCLCLKRDISQGGWWGWGNDFSSGTQGNMQTNFYKTVWG